MAYWISEDDAQRAQPKEPPPIVMPIVRLLAVLSVMVSMVGLIMSGEDAFHRSPSAASADHSGLLKLTNRGSRIGPVSPLVDFSNSRPSSRKSQNPVDPVDICRILTVGEVPARWGESPVVAGEWECFSSTRPIGHRSQQQMKTSVYFQPSLFLMARGRKPDEVTSLRIKLSAANSEAARVGAAMVIVELKKLYQAMGRPIPTGFVRAISILNPRTLQDHETELRFSKEFGTPLRYNLFIEFAKTP
jgi:hypothetical protein